MKTEKIDIFYIATGVYKRFFQNFLDSLKNLFKGYNKQLIVISDDLMDYDHKKYGETIVYIEHYINYPYPFINTNKFQIIDYYAQKYNSENILYFDCETIIEEYDDELNTFLLNKINDNKIVGMYTGIFQHNNINIRNFMWGTDVMSSFGYYHGNFDDFNLLNRTVLYEKDYKWIQTSFFMTKPFILHYFAEKIKALINYNNRILNMKLNFTDETWFNYLNYYCDSDKIYANYFNKEIDQNNLKNEVDPFYTFFKYKYNMPMEKMYIKFGTNNKFEVFILYNEDSLEFIENVHKFFIKNFNKIMISGYGKDEYPINYDLDVYRYHMPIFYRYINLWDDWYTKNNIEILKENTFYYDIIAINQYGDGDMEILCTPTVYGFVNHITEDAFNFNYEEFYEGEYDYIEGRSFSDLENITDIDLVIFSKKYINAWFNNNEYIPKVYKIK